MLKVFHSFSPGLTESILEIYQESLSKKLFGSDNNFVEMLQANGSVKIGHYTLSALETQKVDLTNYLPIQNSSTQYHQLYGKKNTGNGKLSGI